MPVNMKIGSVYSKRLSSTDSNLDPSSITGLSVKVVSYTLGQEEIIPVTVGLTEVSTGVYFVEFIIDTLNFSLGKTYHIVLIGQPSGYSKPFEIASDSFFIEKTKPTFTVEFV